MIRSILPLTWGAFVLAVAAGSLLFISHASKYLENRFFIAKITLIALAGVNMAVFHLIGARNLDQWENDALPPLFGEGRGRPVPVVGLGCSLRAMDRVHHAPVERMQNRILSGIASC